MFRPMVATAVCVVLLASGASAFPGGAELLNKKESFGDSEKGYTPGKGVDKLKEPIAEKFFAFITNHPHKVYTLKLKKGDKIVIEMKSTDMDSVVIVEDSKMNVLAFNDDDPDGGGSLDSRLVWTAPETDSYRIIATNLDKKKGNFHLTVSKAK